MPKVSVIIPTYNRAEMIAETIESVLQQTFADFQLIIVDDGSTDNTKEVIGSLNDSRLEYIYQQNSGVSSARNLGLKKARGQFICFLDSDDLWPRDFLQSMMTNLQASPEYGASYCMRTLLLADGTIQPSYQKEFFCSGQVTAKLFEKTFIQTSAICFRKEILEGLFFDESLTNGEDVDFWLRVSARTKFLFVPDIQIKYRQQPASAESLVFGIKNCSRVRVLERFYFKLGGDKYVPHKTAMRKLSNAWRSVAKKATKAKCRKAAIELAAKAIQYRPMQIRLYLDLMKAYRLDKKDDKMPNWQMPKPLETNINSITEEPR